LLFGCGCREGDAIVGEGFCSDVSRADEGDDEGDGVGVGGAGEKQGGGEDRECEESFAHGGIPFSDWGEVRVRSLLGGVK